MFEHKKLLLGHVAAKHNQDLMLPCRYCTRMFSRNDVREAHERDIHKNGEVGSHFKCTECSAAFDLREDLMRHKITSHYSGPVHTCIQCGKIFKKKSLLTLHMNSHREKSIQCDACLMMFTFVTGLAKHKKLRRCRGLASKSIHDYATKEEIARIAKKQLVEITVNPIVKVEVNIFSDFNDENEVKTVQCKKEKKKPGRKPKPCITITTLPTQGPKIVQTSSIYNNKAAVTIRTLTPREIDQQRAKAAAEANIITSMSSSGRIIRRKLPMQVAKISNKLASNSKKRNFLYQCDKCGIKMDTKFKLLVHFRSHRRNRFHHCPCCEKCFGNLVALKKHCAIFHAETNPFKEKRFQCDLCPKRYLTEFLLGQHQLSHENLKSQQCPQCPFATNAPYDLKNHIKRAHFPSKDFDCPEDNCDKSFKRRCDMENHRNRFTQRSKFT